MTYQYPGNRPYPPHYPPLPSPIRRGVSAKVAALVAAGVFLVIALVLFGVVAYRHSHDKAVDNVGGSKASTARASSSDQWFNAVCQQGFFRDGGGNGQWFTNAVGRASCASSQNPSIWIFIGQYTSEYLADNDAALFRLGGGATAMMGHTDGYWLFAGLTDKSGISLQPLTQFGFTITPAR